MTRRGRPGLAETAEAGRADLRSAVPVTTALRDRLAEGRAVTDVGSIAADVAPQRP